MSYFTVTDVVVVYIYIYIYMYIFIYIYLCIYLCIYLFIIQQNGWKLHGNSICKLRSQVCYSSSWVSRSRNSIIIVSHSFSLYPKNPNNTRGTVLTVIANYRSLSCKTQWQAREPILGVWGHSPQWGPGAKPPVGRSPPEADKIDANGTHIFQ